MGKQWKQWRLFISLGSKITAGSDCSHEIKRRLPLRRKAMTNLDSILKGRDITFPPKVHIVKGFSRSHVWMWELDYKESCALKNWCVWTGCWRKLLRITWTARRSNQSMLKEISPEHSLESLMLKLNHQYFGHLMQRTDSFDKTLLTHLIRPWCWERLKAEKKGMTENEMVGWHHWIDGHELSNVWCWWQAGKPGML